MRVGLTASFVLIAAAMGLSLVPRAEALPAYSGLYEAKYTYRPSCAGCHTNGGGSAVTEYGRDFLRAGANSAAFAKIEAKDSDGDKVLNLAEITAKSNPGDARSTPEKIGDWLGAAAPAAGPAAAAAPAAPPVAPPK